MKSTYHVPVLAGEVVRLLDPNPSDIVVDGTAGGGGHARLLADRLSADGTLVAVDQDPEALEVTRQKLHDVTPRVVVVQSNIRRLSSLLDALGISKVNSILLDLGLSSHQINEAGRGFSFCFEAPLDMRMDPAVEISAKELLVRQLMSRQRTGESTFSIYSVAILAIVLIVEIAAPVPSALPNIFGGGRLAESWNEGRQEQQKRWYKHSFHEVSPFSGASYTSTEIRSTLRLEASSLLLKIVKYLDRGGMILMLIAS